MKNEFNSKISVKSCEKKSKKKYFINSIEFLNKSDYNEMVLVLAALDIFFRTYS